MNGRSSSLSRENKGGVVQVKPEDRASLEAERQRAETLQKATGRPLDYTRENYSAPPVDLPDTKAKQNMTNDTLELNKGSKFSEKIAEQSAALLEIIRTTTDSAMMKHAGDLLQLCQEALKKTEGVESKALDNMVFKVTVAVDIFLKKPTAKNEENAEITGRAVSENATFYTALMAANVPKARVEEFIEKRADEELRIIEEGRKAGKPKKQIDDELERSRRVAVINSYHELEGEGYTINQQMLDDGNKYHKMAAIGSELLEKGRYDDALNARNWQEFSNVAHAAGLGFALAGLITMAEVASGAEAQAPGAEAAAANAQFVNALMQAQLDLATLQINKDKEDMQEQEKKEEERAKESREKKEEPEPSFGSAIMKLMVRYLNPG